MSSQIVQKNGMIYTINSESNPIIQSEKLRFLFKNLSVEKNDFEMRNKLLPCYLNHKKLGVEYNKEIMDAIQKIIR